MHTPLSLFPPEEQTIEGTARALRDGRSTCAAILERCFHQIDLWDEKVRAWVFVDRAGAMRQARALDEELRQGRGRGPLHGIPFGIKDIIDVAGMPTACGFRPWERRVATHDAPVVAALRDAGAVILGKTVTTQFAWIDPPITRNPWDLDRTPGGSSSGSAAAVASGMCLGALGTQTGGSILRPAAFCGVVGFKPGFGRLPVEGILPFAPSLDHPGPFGRTARDVLTIFEALIGAPIAPTTARPPRLLRPSGYFDRRAEVETLDALDVAIGALREAGAAVETLPDPCDFDDILGKHRALMAAEAAEGHEARLDEHEAEYAPHIRALVEEGLTLPATRYIRAARDRERRRAAPVPPAAGFDALVVPATVGPAPDAATTGNPCMNSPFSYLGWPAIALPIGPAPDGLPLAAQLVGLPGVEEPDAALLSTALWCEAVFRRARGAGSP